MKNHLYKAALLAALGLAGVSAAQASTDVLLGFNDAASSSSKNDYVIDLGSYSSLVSSAESNGGTVNLWTGIIGTTFNSAYAFSADASALNDVAAGIVQSFTGTYPHTLLVSAPTSVLSIFTPSGSQFNNAANSAQGVLTGTFASSSDPSTWTGAVAASATAGGTEVSGDDVTDNALVNPMGQLVGGVLDLNLWETTKASTFGSTATDYEEVGSFHIDLNNDMINFTVVPEPSTYALLGLGGLLVLSLRNRLNRKNA
jgi:hypothetical protein